MKNSFALALLGAALALSGCNKASDSAGNSAAPATSATPVAAVAAPAGTRWSENVAATPEGGFVMGNPKAAIKVIEYGSYTCPHCGEFSKESEANEVLAKDYVDTGKVSYEFRSFVRDPLDLTAALVARCGGKDPFFPLTAQVFANQEAMFATVQAKGDDAYKQAMVLPPTQRFGKLAELAGLIDFAKQRGLPEAQVRACLADVKAATALAKGTEDGQKQYNIQGTPTLILNGTVLENVATWPLLVEKLKAAGA